MSFHGEPRFFNRPVRLMWAGFEADTLSLHKAGWQISAEQDIMRRTIRLAFILKNPHNDREAVHAITEVEDWNYFEPEHWRIAKPLKMRHMGPKIEFHTHGVLEVGHWFPADPRPELAPIEVRSLEDYAHFRIPKDIIVPVDCVSDLLERALKVQQPMRDEEMNRRARQVHGSIITLT